MSAILGYVYILTNVALPGLLKIGATTKDPTERARELSAPTGLPLPFTLAYSRHVNFPFQVEAALHRDFDAYRTSDSREFFRLPLHMVITALEQYEETDAIKPYPFAALFASFDQGGPAELTADEQAQCRALERRIL